MSNSDNVTTFEATTDRDDRFKKILNRQFGEFGIVSMVNQSLIFILALIMIVSIMIGIIATLVRSESISTTAIGALTNPITTISTTGNGRTALVL
ncbi:ACH96209.1 GrBNV gp59-like protein [Kallithea virus]|uniref:ACH96209.1 GrBNV gp59-like protein n=1 Tax=Kallithea virus TaxID=1654582 RepID=A0A1S5VG47_9VIRU|nr:ACH96209.1 GrBNV gp59-like protein [Kallithea virus]AQN78606.1 ACH96209.1 GrBNV gp59-like protein [Kallithea virus]